MKPLETATWRGPPAHNLITFFPTFFTLNQFCWRQFPSCDKRCFTMHGKIHSLEQTSQVYQLTDLLLIPGSKIRMVSLQPDYYLFLQCSIVLSTPLDWWRCCLWLLGCKHLKGPHFHRSHLKGLCNLAMNLMGMDRFWLHSWHNASSRQKQTARLLQHSSQHF